MATTATERLDAAVRRLTPRPDDNRLVPLVAAGTAPLNAIATLALEQYRIIDSDRRAFLHLAQRSTGSPAISTFFTAMADGEYIAMSRLHDLAAACRLDQATVRDYRPRAGCQVYPAYLAWLALNAEPADVVLALVANFTAWGKYCATVSHGLRTHYGFDARGCGFFDFFAQPVPGDGERALAAVRAGLDSGLLTEAADHYGDLVLHYELMFWNTLADLAPAGPAR
ncbi:transcriptional regulator [Streptomyces sp. AC563]|uniref:transcriptional regulator n=1 Tax=Streptomyces buecherae TaxID=2763006 RepID=UPI00164E6812|nr:transcriptional regulator [Streptomyces buecherae]MBC3987775.1 transcriptional regulator [Streptomyces buecherae]